jgi:hypothetical protein
MLWGRCWVVFTSTVYVGRRFQADRGLLSSRMVRQMPEKTCGLKVPSTRMAVPSYYPKLLSGLLFNPLKGS